MRASCIDATHVIGVTGGSKVGASPIPPAGVRADRAPSGEALSPNGRYGATNGLLVTGPCDRAHADRVVTATHSSLR